MTAPATLRGRKKTMFDHLHFWSEHTDIEWMVLSPLSMRRRASGTTTTRSSKTDGGLMHHVKNITLLMPSGDPIATKVECFVASTF